MGGRATERAWGKQIRKEVGGVEWAKKEKRERGVRKLTDVGQEVEVYRQSESGERQVLEWVQPKLSRSVALSCGGEKDTIIEWLIN